MGYRKPEWAISYNQVRLPIEGMLNQSNYKILDPEFVLPIRYVGIKDEAEFVGRTNQ